MEHFLTNSIKWIVGIPAAVLGYGVAIFLGVLIAMITNSIGQFAGILRCKNIRVVLRVENLIQYSCLV